MMTGNIGRTRTTVIEIYSHLVDLKCFAILIQNSNLVNFVSYLCFRHISTYLIYLDMLLVYLNFRENISVEKNKLA